MESGNKPALLFDYVRWMLGACLGVLIASLGREGEELRVDEAARRSVLATREAGDVSAPQARPAQSGGGIFCVKGATAR